MSDIVKILPYSIDLSKIVEKTDLRTLFVMDDNEAHRFELAITRGSEAVDLSGCTVTAFFTNFKENKTIKVDGSVENGSAVVTLSAPCYKLHGQFVLIVQIGSGGVDHSVFCGEGYMRTSKAETIIYDDYIIYDVNALLAQISAMKTATDSANAATAKATNAASTANTAAGNADAKAQAAQTAAEAANAAASKWDESLAADSEKLGGAPAADYLLKTGTAVNSEKLGGAPAADYLLKTGTAANAASLNGKSAEYYAKAVPVIGEISEAEAETSAQGHLVDAYVVKQLLDRFVTETAKVAMDSTYASGNVTIKKSGNVVSVMVPNTHFSNMQVGADNIIATIPAEYKPGSALFYVVKNDRGTMYMGTSGQIVFLPTGESVYAEAFFTYVV